MTFTTFLIITLCYFSATCAPAAWLLYQYQRKDRSK